MLTTAAYNQAQRRKRKQTQRQILQAQRRDAQRQTRLYSLANHALHHKQAILTGQLLACPAVLTAAAGLTNMLEHLDRHRPDPEVSRLLSGQFGRFGTDSVDDVLTWLALLAGCDLPMAQREALSSIVEDGYVTATSLLRHVWQTPPAALPTSLDHLMRLATEERLRHCAAA